MSKLTPSTLPSTYDYHTHINPTFPLGISTPWAYQEWISKNTTQVRHLMTTNGMKTFTQLQQEIELPNQEIFCYHQIKHFLQTIVLCPVGSRMLTSFKTKCTLGSHALCMILFLYMQILTMHSQKQPVCFKK